MNTPQAGILLPLPPMIKLSESYDTLYYSLYPDKAHFQSKLSSPGRKKSRTS